MGALPRPQITIVPREKQLFWRPLRRRRRQRQRRRNRSFKLIVDWSVAESSRWPVLDGPIDSHLMDIGVYGDHYVMSPSFAPTSLLRPPLGDRTSPLARRRRSSNHFIWQNTISLIGFFSPDRRGVFTATCAGPRCLIVSTTERSLVSCWSRDDPNAVQPLSPDMRNVPRSCIVI